jgi:hypothetical protein
MTNAKQLLSAINPNSGEVFRTSTKRPYKFVVFHYGQSAQERKDGLDFSAVCVGECLHLTLEAALKDAASNPRAVMAALSVVS